MTPRELYNKMQSGDDVTGQMDSVHAAFARTILRRQAGSLTKEKCVEKITFMPENANPWGVEIVFWDGELSEEAQETLSKMHQNAHRTEILVGDETTMAVFYIFTVEGNAE